MANPWFAFKLFTVYHNQCAMKVGTDGVLLGAWIITSGVQTLLDVGTGSGLIALMCAQRSEAFIEAVEIDEKAFNQAVDNCRNSPWNNRIQVFHGPFQQFARLSEKKYDLIVSNPPYFRNSLKPQTSARMRARHDVHLNYESLIYWSATLLSPKGRLGVIVPFDDATHFTELAYLSGLYPLRLTKVIPHAGKTYTRCLAEYSKRMDVSCITDELVIKREDRNEYTDDFKSLTGDFYLNL